MSSLGLLPCAPPALPPQLEDWLAGSLPEGGRVGIDPWCHTVNSVRTLQRKLEEAGRVSACRAEGRGWVEWSGPEVDV